MPIPAVHNASSDPAAQQLAELTRHSEWARSCRWRILTCTVTGAGEVVRGGRQEVSRGPSDPVLCVGISGPVGMCACIRETARLQRTGKHATHDSTWQLTCADRAWTVEAGRMAAGEDCASDHGPCLEHKTSVYGVICMKCA